MSTQPHQDLVARIEAAERRIRPHIIETPLLESSHYSTGTGATVLFKCENRQRTGSFKVRGATNKVLSLSESARRKGIVTASSGNHGKGVAQALASLGEQAVVFVPTVADTAKMAAMEALGADVRTHGDDGVITETHARSYAADHDMTFVSPYNDLDVMAGQGTIGVEIDRQADELDAVFVAVGGGGLIGGIAAWLKSARPDVEIVGCQPEASQVMKLSVEAGEIVDVPSLPTLSDGTAGGIEPGSVTFPVNRDLVDRFITVTEDEIAASLREFHEAHDGSADMRIEGAAAVPIAALRREADRYRGRTVAVVLCGANISDETLREIGIV